MSKLFPHHRGQMSEAFRTVMFLSASGGLQDAYTYIGRGKVFANAQTGNIVLMAVHAFAGEWGRVLHYLVPLCFFALGVFAAELMHQHGVLDGLGTATKLQHPRPDRRVVDPGEIAGQLLVGHAHGSGHCPKLHAQELGIARADIGGLGELHVLAGLQDLHRARLQPGQCCTTGIRQSFTHQVVLR